MSELSIDSTYGVIVIQDLKVLHVDDNYAKIYGYADGNDLLIHIDSFLDLIPERFHSKACENYHDTIAGKIYPRGHTYVNIDRSGREFTVFSVDHVIDWNDKPALQVTVIDLSVVVEANRRIREKDRMFTKLIMQSGQGIMVHRGFKPLMVNQAWVNAIHAESVEQVLSMDSILSIIPLEHQEDAKQQYQQIISGEVVGKSVVSENICFDGVRRYFNIYNNVIDWDYAPAIQVVLEDITDKVKYEKALAHRATHDSLTDLLNRNAIYDWIDEKMQNNITLTCILADIDNFKMINDNHGHAAGDQVILTLARIFSKNIAKINGIVGRWGGEEFIVFVSSADNETVYHLIESVRTQFAAYIFETDSCQFSATVSIGIGFNCICDENTVIDDLIKTADKRLYMAKANGKNQVSATDCVCCNENN
ncbi:diguanylate cyclase [Shewanella maritima]|uniref:sensor domain-containing diguanylate cyclase n=1 Tax=Shewanella maritima TaxID=2520507 RepID=UPI0037361097